MTATLAGCSFLSTDPDQGNETTGKAGSHGGVEAPMLAELVEQGELPPVAERLPDEPLVITPVDRVGTYGGTWRTAIQDAADTSWLERTIGLENLVAWSASPEWSGRRDDVLPNLATSWEVDSSATTYTFRLMQGVRWSDGELFTAEDIVFAMNDVLSDPDLYPVSPFPGKAEAIGDGSVKVVLDEPNGQFLQRLASPDGRPLTSMPKHYLQKFHKSYNDKADDLAKKEGEDGWVELFLAKSDTWANIERPRLTAWLLTNELGDGSKVAAERNPFYWKTDPDGRQLPYIDKINYDIVSDAEVLSLKITNGEIDFHTRHVNSLQNKPVFARAREDAGFDFMKLIPSAPSNTMLIMFNLTHKDQVKREIFRNPDFRIGLSHAINREEIITATLQKQGTPAQHGPRPESPYYNERLMTQYTEYDLDRANSHLDDAGYRDRDDEGLRIGPDGRPIRFKIDTTEIFGQPWVEILELVKASWREVGIGMDISNMERTLHNARTAANEHDAQVWEGQGGLDVLIRPGDFVPILPSQARYGPLWAEWYVTGGESGEEPPPATRSQIELYQQMLQTYDQGEQDKLLKRILAGAAEEFYSIGISLIPESYGIVKNDFHNVPDAIVESFLYSTPAPTNPCQYFISREAS